MRRALTRTRSLLLCLTTVLVGLAFVRPTEARLQPYYVLTDANFNQIKPRILFVVDSSNSMQRVAATSSIRHCGVRANATSTANWADCETPGHPLESRMSVARRAMNEVVQRLGDSADFAYMTYDQYEEPTTVPAKCVWNDGSGNEFRRFVWVHESLQRVGSTNSWEPIQHYSGVQGTWTICSGHDPTVPNRPVKYPYPYLRRDNLGRNSNFNANVSLTDPLPPSPMIDTRPGQINHDYNARRKVQWFPRFMGVRTRLDGATDPAETILRDTVGDYSPNNTMAEKRAEVKNFDFYYWPYVDGFPGYAIWQARTLDTNWQDRYNISNAGTKGRYATGVVGSRRYFEGELYQPFYLSPTEQAGIPSNLRGPNSRDEALAGVRTFTSPMIMGGTDPISGGITPWLGTIGTIPAVATNDNSYHSHKTVASYLKFLKDQVGADTLCTPISVVIVTDGFPAPASEGGAPLYSALAAIRKTWDVKTYVVGIYLATAGQLNDMACAAAGACAGLCSTPCQDSPTNAWDTCADAAAPTTSCAYLANSAEELADTLTNIVQGQIDINLGSGPGSTVAEFGVGTEGQLGDGEVVQTNITADTDWPGWRGHVRRQLCTDMDPANPAQLAPWCVDQPFTSDERLEPRWGPCGYSRNWDAGECLRITDWKARRIYYRRPNGRVRRIHRASNGLPTGAFKRDLVTYGIFPNDSNLDANAASFVEFIAGAAAPGGWKLPGLANSAPIVARRIPRHDYAFAPPVPIRDPHCAGKQLSSADATLPVSLQRFAIDSWDPDRRLPNPRAHFEYQEAVIVGDDMGLVHAFGMNTGNEMWAFLPKFMLQSLKAQWQNGPADMGQPRPIEDHIYGMAGTINQAWVYDDSALKWRHLAVIGMGPGGQEYIAFDLSHMSPASPSGPIEVLWTTEDSGLKAGYDAVLGETWARPAISYSLPNNLISDVPKAYLIMTSGYGTAAGSTGTGRSMLLVDAITGAIVEQQDSVWTPTSPTRRIDPNNYGMVTDPAVSSQCISRYWAEMQEAYVVDPIGKLFRYDLDPNSDEDDSNRAWAGAARPAVRFKACLQPTAAVNSSLSTCNVSHNVGEPFAFSPAVTALDRIDPGSGNASGYISAGDDDQYLLAMVSGSPSDDTLAPDPGTYGERFFPSLYLLVDDHRSDGHAGFNIPPGQPPMTVGTIGVYDGYMRLPVTELTRRREFTPFPTSATYTETRRFGRLTRPTRSPRIQIFGATDGGQADDTVEVLFITYYLWEPGTKQCDDRWYDAPNKEWYYDEGSNYEVTFRLTSSSASGFDFQNGVTDSGVTFGSGFGAPGLSLVGVTQVTDGACADGVCGGSAPGPKPRKPCDPNEAPERRGRRSQVHSIATGNVPGFAPRG